MAKLEKDDIEKTLEMFISFMKENKLLPEKVDKKTLIEELTPSLENAELTANDVRDANVQKRLMGAIAAHVLGSEKMEKDCMLALGSDEKRLENPKQDALLLQTTCLLQTLTKDAANAPATAPQLKPDMLAKKLMQKFKEQELKKCDGNKEKEKNVEANASILEKQLADSLKMMFGGDDPRITGEVPIPIIGAVMTNANGWTNMTIPDPNSTALMTEMNTFNTNKADPNGFESMLAQSALAVGSTAPALLLATNDVLDSLQDFVSHNCTLPKTPENKYGVH